MQRVRPGDPAWPSAAGWQALGRAVGGRLVEVTSPFAACRSSGSPGCAELLRTLRNPYAIGDHVALTQTTGWLDAWQSAPSAYAVAATTTQDVVAAVNFARAYRLRLVIKGGGHSYQGTSCCADSLLIWTRGMSTIALNDAFVAQGCEGFDAPQPAVSVGAGATWMHVYDAVTTQGGRYVQGGGCATVGVAGLVQSGGFGSFSKNYGTAAAGLLEAEVVTADGEARIANRRRHADLFWALKGGGGGTFGVVTRLTLRTRELPAFFGRVFTSIKASSDAAFGSLVMAFVDFYAERLFNRHWGESVTFGPGNTLRVAMAFQGLDHDEAARIWQPFLDRFASRHDDFTVAPPPAVLAIAARQLWNPEALLRVPGLVTADDRPGAPEANLFWTSTRDEAGQFLHAYQSLWLPASLLDDAARERLADALHVGSRHWPIALHFNKGLAGAPAEEVVAARGTAMNPAALDAFALALSAAASGPGIPGVHDEADLTAARQHAAAVRSAMLPLRALAGRASYVSESDYFEADWQQSFWGSRYARLRAVKRRYDPDGLFTVHHGVGSEDWSDDGFRRNAATA